MSAPDEKTRVCFVLPSLAPGGTERQLLYLLRGLQDTHDCAVVCTRTGGAWLERARACGAQVHELNSWGGWDFRIGPRVRAIFQSIRPQVVHTFLFGFDRPAIRAAQAAGVRAVISSRRELAAWMKPRHVRAQRRANALTNCIVANSHAVAEFAATQEGIETGRIRVIHNGIDMGELAPGHEPEDTRARLGIATDKRVVGMVANFSPVKDHALFIAMAKYLTRRRDDLHFLLVGGGRLYEQIEKAVREGGMQEQFTMTSTSADTADLVASMDVCVLTSLREGFPNAILEAMALGRPVVTARVGGIPELVEDGASGLLVSSRNPDDFAAAVVRCLDDSTMAKSLGEQARARALNEFPAERMVESYRALYAELLARANG